MKKIVYSIYPVFINVYTIWLLYMMFFAYNRSTADPVLYEIRAYPFDTLKHLIFEENYGTEKYRNLLGNIAGFIPYGFLGILYPKLSRYIPLFITFFIAINYIEFSQYFFKRGYAELDDVMMNTFGMTIGFLIYKIFFARSGEKST
ncbi:MAG: VanZ family protein [Bergeyella sp.]